MLNTQNAEAIFKEAEELVNGAKKDVSRALRRFLQRTVPDGSVVQIFNEKEQALTQTQFNHLRAYAEGLREKVTSVYCYGVAIPSETLASKAKKFVNNQFSLNLEYETATLSQLQAAVDIVYAVATVYRNFAADPDGAVYRTTPKGRRELDAQRRGA